MAIEDEAHIKLILDSAAVDASVNRTTKAMGAIEDRGRALQFRMGLIQNEMKAAAMGMSKLQRRFARMGVHYALAEVSSTIASGSGFDKSPIGRIATNTVSAGLMGLSAGPHAAIAATVTALVATATTELFKVTQELKNAQILQEEENEKTNRKIQVDLIGSLQRELAEIRASNERNVRDIHELREAERRRSEEFRGRIDSVLDMLAQESLAQAE